MGSPRKLWDYGVLWINQTMQMTYRKPDGLIGIFPLQDVTGDKPDISDYLDFSFYDHISYKENEGLWMTAI